jgi:beta-phosphoglucomutase family hydrolase
MAKGVIWDMDGVLADTAQFHYQAWAKIFADRGVKFSWEDFAHSFGMRNDRIIPKVLGRRCTEEEIMSIDKEKEALFREFAKGQIKPLDYLKDLLTSLKNKGFKMAVASSGTPENLKLVIEECKLAPFFLYLVNGKEVHHGKPHPEMFLLAAKKLGVSPAKCIVVEDAHAGIEGANRAGMKCIAITSTHKRETLKGVDIIVDSFKELGPETFNKLIDAE